MSMSRENATKTGTSDDVLDYYSRNWEKIAKCYEIGADGLPCDPAWYRRRLYQQFLDRVKPQSVLDIGCGGGWTVLDALERGVDARGIEPVRELQEHGCRLLADHGYDPKAIALDDLASLEGLPKESQDCIALLSVLPHVPSASWDHVHQQIARTLRPGGRLIAAYRNELFDLFTFNSISIEFFDKSLWDIDELKRLQKDRVIEDLKRLITNPDVPGPYFTAAKDSSFGKLARVKSNPLTMPAYLAGYGLNVERTRFFHFHCVPPLMASSVSDFKAINHDLELALSDDWRGNFMAAIFMVEIVKS